VGFWSSAPGILLRDDAARSYVAITPDAERGPVRLRRPVRRHARTVEIHRLMSVALDDPADSTTLTSV
jgi:hypothetical protein